MHTFVNWNCPKYGTKYIFQKQSVSWPGFEFAASESKDEVFPQSARTVSWLVISADAEKAQSTLLLDFAWFCLPFPLFLLSLLCKAGWGGKYQVLVLSLNKGLLVCASCIPTMLREFAFAEEGHKLKQNLSHWMLFFPHTFSLFPLTGVRTRKSCWSFLKRRTQLDVLQLQTNI